MKKNEIIELNGVEYTLELNRDSFLQIDKLCNIEKTMEIANGNLYEYMDDVELTDDFNLDDLKVNEEDLENKIKEKEKVLYRALERSFLIWLEPNHHLKPSEVKEILKPYFEDEKKANWLGEQWGKYINECVEIRNQYVEERKNLEALANKKN